MTGWAWRRLTRWLLGASTMLAGLIALAPSPAVAGCGHGPTALAHLDALVAAGALPEAEIPADRSRPPGPCNGPMCSKAPAAPSAPVATTFLVEPWACLSEALAPPAVCSQRLRPCDAARPAPTPCGLSVFHPPRIAAV